MIDKAGAMSAPTFPTDELDTHIRKVLAAYSGPAHDGWFRAGMEHARHLETLARSERARAGWVRRKAKTATEEAMP